MDRDQTFWVTYKGRLTKNSQNFKFYKNEEKWRLEKPSLIIFI